MFYMSALIVLTIIQTLVSMTRLIKIADAIVHKATTLAEANSDAEVYVSAIIHRNDLVDENDSVAAVNNKIDATNDKLKELCDSEKVHLRRQCQHRFPGPIRRFTFK